MKRQTLAYVTSVFGLLLAACGGAAPSGDGVSSTTALVEALRTAGAQVEMGDMVEQPFFSPTGQVIVVDGADVQVFEYPDEAARAAESATISPDGSSVGTSMITWVDRPHFFAQGRLIVLYVGSDPAILDRLEGVLGAPITEPGY